MFKTQGALSLGDWSLSLYLKFLVSSYVRVLMILNIDGKISFRIEIDTTSVCRLHRRPIQFIMLVPVGLLLPL